jgi:methionyl-tRNA formyltransferase
MRVIFMGTPAFAVPTLQALIDSEHEVVAAYTQPPRPSGRGMKLTPSPVQQLAEKHGIPVHIPTSLKDPAEQGIFAAYHADVAVVAAYGLLLPPAILGGARHGCINIHPSDLPRWRGAAPLQRTIMAADASTACCIMQMEAGLDTGPVLARTRYDIAPGTTTGQLHDAMATLGAQMVLEVLPQLGVLHAQPQPEHGVSYAAKITRDDQPLRWDKPASALFNQVLGLAPVPGAVMGLNGELIKVYAASLETGDAMKPAGTLLDDRLLVNAGDGMALRLLQLQRAGKTRQEAEAFLQGFPVPAGIRAEDT